MCMSVHVCLHTCIGVNLCICVCGSTRYFCVCFKDEQLFRFFNWFIWETWLFFCGLMYVLFGSSKNNLKDNLYFLFIYFFFLRTIFRLSHCIRSLVYFQKMGRNPRAITEQTRKINFNTLHLFCKFNRVYSLLRFFFL